MKNVYEFHQLVRLHRGPVNTCICDLLKGNIYHLPNRVVDKFENRCYSEIPDLLASLTEAELIIEVEENAWIPASLEEDETPDTFPLLLEVEDGIDVEFTLGLLAKRGIKINKVHLFGSQEHIELSSGIPVTNLKKDFSLCKELSTITGDFYDIKESAYIFNKEYNSCWGAKIAITKDGNIRPCIYSQLVIGSIVDEKSSNFKDRSNHHRKITKDNIVKCKNCEFKYVCFDCRVIAMERGGDLYATNPNCSYDPFHGIWRI